MPSFAAVVQLTRDDHFITYFLCCGNFQWKYFYEYISSFFKTSNIEVQRGFRSGRCKYILTQKVFAHVIVWEKNKTKQKQTKQKPFMTFFQERKHLMWFGGSGDFFWLLIIMGLDNGGRKGRLIIIWKLYDIFSVLGFMVKFKFKNI